MVLGTVLVRAFSHHVRTSASLFHLDVGGVNGGFGARPSTALGNLSWMRQVAAQWQPSAAAVEQTSTHTEASHDVFTPLSKVETGLRLRRVFVWLGLA